MVKIDRFKKHSFNESLVDDFIKAFGINESNDDSQTIDLILKRYKQEFGDKTPTHQEFADFYHKLRSEGIDSILIFDTLDGIIDNEGDLKKSSPWKRIEKKTLSDLKLDTKLVFTFGAGIGALYPVVQKMMENLNISVDMTRETTVLLTITCITIIYLEEKKFKSPEEEVKLTKDSKSMLEELRMRGIGDGIVKKVMKSIEAIKNVFSVVSKHIGAVVGGVIDMFGYTAILIPIMNSILWVIGKYEMSVDAVIQNFFSLGLGVSSRIAKHGLVELINKLRGFLSNKTSNDIIDELETPVIQRFGDIRDDEQEGELIKEQ
jgi:hypothetical protein